MLPLPPGHPLPQSDSRHGPPSAHRQYCGHTAPPRKERETSSFPVSGLIRSLPSLYRFHVWFKCNGREGAPIGRGESIHFQLNCGCCAHIFLFLVDHFLFWLAFSGVPARRACQLYTLRTKLRLLSSQFPVSCWLPQESANPRANSIHFELNYGC